MDANKEKKLEEIEYKIHHSCGLCHYGQFKSGASFGTCRLIKYSHLKHNEKDRELSVTRYGSCKKFFRKNFDEIKSLFGGFLRFFK